MIEDLPKTISKRSKLSQNVQNFLKTAETIRNSETMLKQLKTILRLSKVLSELPKNKKLSKNNKSPCQKYIVNNVITAEINVRTTENNVKTAENNDRAKKNYEKMAEYEYGHTIWTVLYMLVSRLSMLICQVYCMYIYILYAQCTLLKGSKRDFSRIACLGLIPFITCDLT